MLSALVNKTFPSFFTSFLILIKIFIFSVTMAAGYTSKQNHQQSTPGIRETITTPKGLKITVCLCDVTILDGDGIVSAEGEQMKGKGNIAQRLITLGGSEYEKKRSDLKTKHSSFKEGSVYDLPVNEKKLNHRYVLNVITPKYGKPDWTAVMVKLYDNIMKVAKRLNLKKITLPLLGSGKRIKNNNRKEGNVFI